MTPGFADELRLSANRGLSVATAALEPVKAEFPWLSYADVYTLAATVALKTALSQSSQLVPSWFPGRVDAPRGRGVDSSALLPDPSDAWIAPASPPPVKVKDRGSAWVSQMDNTSAVLRRRFGATMGFSDRETVALMGAHGLGKAHPNATGFGLQWVPGSSQSDVPIMLDNTFYKSMFPFIAQGGSVPDAQQQQANVNAILTS